MFLNITYSNRPDRAAQLTEHPASPQSRKFDSRRGKACFSDLSIYQPYESVNKVAGNFHFSTCSLVLSTRYPKNQEHIHL